LFVAWDIQIRVGEVACEQRPRVVRYLFRNLQRIPVEWLEQVLFADDAQLFAVPVIREGLDDVGAGVNELAVKLGDDAG